MKRIALLTITLFIATTAFCRVPKAALSDKIASLAGMEIKSVSPHVVSTLFGEPDKIQENTKKNIWYYNFENTRLTIYWDNQANRMSHYTISSITDSKPEWNNDRAKKIKSGRSEMADVVKILGTPKNMKVKEVNQQMRYDYKEVVLNLFFRNGVLVNYTMY